MTWEELKEEAKKMGLKNTIIEGTCIEIEDELWFDYDGGFGISNGDGTYKIISNDRTPDQMLAIMKALQ